MLVNESINNYPQKVQIVRNDTGEQIYESGAIAVGSNNVDRAIYHLSQRGVKFDLDSKNVKNGKTVACYFADEIGGFAFHLVQA